MLDSDDDFVEDSSSSRSRKTSVKKAAKPAKGTIQAKKAALKESPLVKVRRKLFVPNILTCQIFSPNAYRTLKGDSFGLFLNSTLLHLPPLRFHCVRGCWDRT
jgi:hypothetical protein